ncbi:MAG TPA: sensor histidine kinase [Gallionellaceae bacterium]|nr:sensor histidine kinase [Gallionellaceae bacterium]
MKSDLLNTLKKQLSIELEQEHVDFQAIAELNKKILECDKSSVRFSIDARHIHRLGFELVGRQETALSELIKNSYDADATEVRIDFVAFDKPGGFLTIADDGSGMTEETIRSAWMRLSTNDKELSPISDRFKRSRAGRKGIGRFAVERLGKELILESGVLGELQGVRVQFNWDDVFKPDVDIGMLSFSIERFDKAPEAHGTKLTIVTMRDRWTEAQLKRVWKSVILLQPPYKVRRTYRGKALTKTEGKELDPGFSVVINGKSSSEIQAEFSLDKTFLDQRLARISGYIDKDDRAHILLESKKLGFSDKITLDRKFELVGETSFEADYFIYLPEFIEGFSTRTATDVGSEYGGIRVYRDGFRVLPYGEPRDDWLKLAYDTGRRNIIVPAHNVNFFGQLELSSDVNVLLEETSSREGLIENEAFVQLADFVRSGLEWAALRVAAARERKQTAGQKDFTSKRGKPSERVKKIFEDVSATSSQSGPSGASAVPADVLKEAQEEVQKIVENFEQEQEQREKAHLRYEELLRILASLGTSIAVFSHEIRGALNGFSGSILNLKGLLADLGAKDKAKKPIDDVEASLSQLNDLASYVMSLIAHTAKREKNEIAVHSVITEFVSQFKHYLDTRQVEFEVAINPPYLRTTPMHRSEIDSVLFNFLTNSIKAMDRANTGNRKIKISADREGEYVRIGFQDTGSGVDPAIADKIFDAFFTTHQYGDDELVGPGSGLGLKIVSDIASANSGLVRLGDAEQGFNCRFEFLVPAAIAQQ